MWYLRIIYRRIRDWFIPQVIGPSGLIPVGRAVLLKPYDPEVSRSPLIIPDSAKEGIRMREARGIVLAVGSETWLREGRPRAKIGDKVMISRFCGVLIQGPCDGEMYRMVNDEDIYCVIGKELANE